MHNDAPIPLGLCQCGCGQRTTPADATRQNRQQIKGQPQRFVRGHRSDRWAGPDYRIEDHGYETPCWMWQRRLDSNGYGRLGHRWAHVAMYQAAKGPIPAGLELDHLCRNPPCVNPDHLEAISHTENIRRGKATRLTPDDVRMIRALASSLSHAEIAERFGIAKGYVPHVVHRRNWKDV
jgi:hypothetical protein